MWAGGETDFKVLWTKPFFTTRGSHPSLNYFVILVAYMVQFVAISSKKVLKVFKVGKEIHSSKLSIPHNYRIHLVVCHFITFFFWGIVASHFNCMFCCVLYYKTSAKAHSGPQLSVSGQEPAVGANTGLKTAALFTTAAACQFEDDEKKLHNSYINLNQLNHIIANKKTVTIAACK